MNRRRQTKKVWVAGLRDSLISCLLKVLKDFCPCNQCEGKIVHVEKEFTFAYTV